MEKNYRSETNFVSIKQKHRALEICGTV